MHCQAPSAIAHSLLQYARKILDQSGGCDVSNLHDSMNRFYTYLFILCVGMYECVSTTPYIIGSICVIVYIILFRYRGSRGGGGVYVGSQWELSN